METEEIRKQIVKLMEKRDRAWLDSKSPKEAEEVVDECDRMIRSLYSKLAFQAEINYEAVETFQEIIRNQCDEITALKEKANAYDRLMSGGKKTLKEIANIFGAIVAMDESGRLHLFGVAPKVNENVEEWQPAYQSYYEKVPICDINFSGDWKDSLTLPDGWEEK